MSRHPIEFQSAEGAVDYLEVDGCGIIRIHAWYNDFKEGESSQPSLRLNGKSELKSINHFRVQREDVKKALSTETEFHGVVFEFLCSEADAERGERSYKVYWESECIASGMDNTLIQAPSYPYLLNDERVFHRDWIYCSGLPVDYLNPEVLSLAKTLRGPILDFGCGTGGLVEALRSGDVDVTGLELDRPEIRKALPKDSEVFVDLYDGSMPLPYEDGVFESVILSEVLEHLADPEDVMGEVARICNGQLLVTVPDLSGVPLNHKNGVVPWHLLESTHVNFFNSTSLVVFLKNWFPKVDLYRIGRTETNNSQWWGGLMALAKK
jgi:2-polyprenyl-3-methyl-5-hydroxy-6-metoxy-1,4-benzoquinol methylase